MTWFDYGVLIVLVLSVVVSMLRGLALEIVSLGGWIAAFVLAVGFGGALGEYMPESLGPGLRPVAGFFALFLGALVVAGFIGLLVQRMVRAAEWTWTDRALGGAFGMLRGLIIVLGLVMIGGMTALPRDPFWRNAVLSGPLETMVLGLRPLLPDRIAQRIHYR
ncbi:MAG TPA: CvpA family protein [Burkholderiales bacterium]